MLKIVNDDVTIHIPSESYLTHNKEKEVSKPTFTPKITMKTKGASEYM